MTKLVWTEQALGVRKAFMMPHMELTVLPPRSYLGLCSYEPRINNGRYIDSRIGEPRETVEDAMEEAEAMAVKLLEREGREIVTALATLGTPCPDWAATSCFECL